MTETTGKRDGTGRRSSAGERTQTALLKLGSAEFISRACGLLRSIVVWRTLGPQLMGAALPMIIIADFLDRVFSLHPSMVIVQDKQGGSGHYRRTLQTIIAVRGIILGIAIIVLAIPLAVLNELDDSPWYVAAFMVIGLVPMIRGFAHIDVQRRYRKREFGPLAQVQIWREVGSLVTAVVLCLVLTSFWIPILVRVNAAIILVFLTFKLARRPYQFGWNKQDAIRILLFIAPLIVAGLIVFLSVQGPKQLVSSAGFLFGQFEFTKVDLAILSNALMFAIIPAGIGGRLIQGPWSPKLASLRDEPERFGASFAVMQRFAYSVSMATLILIGPGTIWIVALYGESYAAAGPIVTVLAFRTALKLGGAGTRCAMLSLGKSKYVMIMNLGGLIGPLGAAWVILKGGTLIEIAYWITLSEVLSFVTGNLLVKRTMKQLRLSDIWLVPLVLITAGAGILFLEMALINGMNHYLAILLVSIVACGSLGACMVAFPQIRPGRIKRRAAAGGD